MKLNIQIFKRKQREEAYKGKCLNGCKPEGTARKAVYISREKHSGHGGRKRDDHIRLYRPHRHRTP